MMISIEKLKSVSKNKINIYKNCGLYHSMGQCYFVAEKVTMDWLVGNCSRESKYDKEKGVDKLELCKKCGHCSLLFLV